MLLKVQQLRVAVACGAAEGAGQHTWLCCRHVKQCCIAVTLQQVHCNMHMQQVWALAKEDWVIEQVRRRLLTVSL